MPRLMKVNRWQRGPHDRLYITSPEGVELGWYDLRTQRHHLTVPSMWPEFAHTVTWWRNLPKGSQADSANPHTANQDLVGTRPGAALRHRAERLRPGLVVRVLARIARRRTAERSWTVGEAGEKAVAAKLDKLTRHGWKVLHSIDTGAGDIDHLLIGRSGVYVINTKHHPGGVLEVLPDDVTVNGRRRPYPAQVTREAGLARAALHNALGHPVYVGPMLVIHGHETITGWRRNKPTGVQVLPSRAIRWWAMLPGRTIHTPGDIEKIYAAAADSSTWRSQAPAPAAAAAAARPRRTVEVAMALPSVSAIAPQWSAAGPCGDGRPWGPLREFPADPANPRTDRWRELILAGDLGDLLSAQQIAIELGLPFDEFRQLVIDSEFYWFRQRAGRPALPPPSAPDYHGEPEWFRHELAVHFGAAPVPRDQIRSIYDQLD